MDLPEALAWYVQLAKTPGWKEYTWARVKEMAADCPCLWGDLPSLLVDEMEKKACRNS